MTKDQRSYLTKKLIYKSSRRGCKEADIMLGNFAKIYLEDLTDNELIAFDIILDETEADIMSWINKSAAIPERISASLIKRISKMDIIQ